MPALRSRAGGSDPPLRASHQFNGHRFPHQDVTPEKCCQGGLTTLARYGREHFARLGRAGGTAKGAGAGQPVVGRATQEPRIPVAEVKVRIEAARILKRFHGGADLDPAELERVADFLRGSVLTSKGVDHVGG